MRKDTLLFFLLSMYGAASWASETTAQTMDLAEYTRICRELIGDIPQLDSRKAVPIPITVDGKKPRRYVAEMNCDKPSMLPETCGQGQCIPYSKVQLLRDDEQAQIVALFRMKFIRGKRSHEYDEVDLIAHSVSNGATCFFQATPPECAIDSTLDGHDVPSPDSAEGAAYWQPLEKVLAAGCGDCHDNDPFYYSPYIAQVIDHVPADPLGKYFFDIGPFKQWNPLVSVSTRGNTCTGCHRIGNTFTCGHGLEQVTGTGYVENADHWASTYPGSHWMPPDNMWSERQWRVTYDKAVNDLKNCCGASYKNSAECIKTPIH